MASIHMECATIDIRKRGLENREGTKGALIILQLRMENLVVAYHILFLLTRSPRTRDISNIDVKHTQHKWHS